METRVIISCINNDSFSITKGTSSTIISKNGFVDCTFKYRNEIISHMKEICNIHDDEEVTVTPAAATLIDSICDANRLLF